MPRINHPSHRKQGFTLVELSIVLVIIGLLTGGVLSGQSLIRAAELKAATNEFSRYMTAVRAFRDKYQAMPGDMNNATQFWGRMNSNTDCVTNSTAAVTGSGTCDGNGNAAFEAWVAGKSAEQYQFWRQLALAGLIEGSYTGTAGAAGSAATNADNSPRSRVQNAYWQSGTDTTGLTGHASIFNRGAVGGILQFGALYNTDGSGNRNPILKPEEAWNIDTKIDDGKPAVGNFQVRTNESTQAMSECTTAASTADLAAQYQLTSSSIGCVGLFYHVF